MATGVPAAAEAARKAPMHEHLATEARQETRNENANLLHKLGLAARTMNPIRPRSSAAVYLFLAELSVGVLTSEK